MGWLEREKQLHALHARVAAVDDDAFAALFRAHASSAFRLAYRLCGDRSRAEDAVAEAFSRVYVHWRGGRVHDPGSYLRRAVVNEIYGGFRRLRVERAWQERRSADERGALELDQHIVDADQLRAALARLSPGQRTALVLRYWEGLSEAETAHAMDCAPGTVKSHVHRALRALRVSLGDESMTRGAR